MEKKELYIEEKMVNQVYTKIFDRISLKKRSIYEKNISTKQNQKKKNSWVQSKNENKRWKKSVSKKKGKRQKKISGLSKKEIEIVLKKGKKYSSINFLLFYFPFNELKVSPIVSKKISKKAVVRNKIKRRVRSIAKELLKKGGYAVVVKNDISNNNFQDLKDEFKKLISKIN